MPLENSGLFYVKRLADKLYWLSPPGSMQERNADTESNVGQAHFSAMRKLGAILGNISSSILEK
jgi:hypothetical protein